MPAATRAEQLSKVVQPINRPTLLRSLSPQKGSQPGAFLDDFAGEKVSAASPTKGGGAPPPCREPLVRGGSRSAWAVDAEANAASASSLLSVDSPFRPSFAAGGNPDVGAAGSKLLRADPSGSWRSLGER